MSDFSYKIGGFFSDRIAITTSSHKWTNDKAISGLFSYKVTNTGLAKLLLGDNRESLKTRGYTTLTLMGGKEVYVKAQFIDAIAAVKALKEDYAKGSIPITVTVRKIYDFLKKHPINAEGSYITILQEMALGKARDDKGELVWKMHTIIDGSHSTTVNPSQATSVAKIYREREKEISSYGEYLAARSRTDKVLDKVNPRQNAIGLPKKPIFTEDIKIISVYNLEDEKIKTIRGYGFAEAAYKSDCLTQNYQKKELPSMIACLVQGSKILLENEVYHLDVKLDNIGYVGKGHAEHFDLDGSILGDEPLKNSPATHTSDSTCKKDLGELEKAERDSGEGLKDSSKKILSEMHIFSLGASIYRMATTKRPYSLEQHDDKEELRYPSKALENAVLKKKLRECGAGFSEAQIDIIIKMVSLDRKDRPSIKEIEDAFPKGLIQKKTGI